MNIRYWARAGVLALASAAVFGWGMSPVLAQSPPTASASSTTGQSYALTLRGNANVLNYGSEPIEDSGDCTYCNTDGCACLFASGGNSTVWKWDGNAFSKVSFTLELDYLDQELDSGTGNNCDPAIGVIEVDGTYAPNAVDFETTGMLCDNADFGSTFTGSYVIVGGDGLYAAASGSGGVSFGVNQQSAEFEAVANASPTVYGQLQITGNISLTTQVPACSGVAVNGVKAAC